MKNHADGRKRIFPLLLWLVFCLGCLTWLYFRPVKISLHLRAERNFILKLTSADPGGGQQVFSETVTPAKTRYDFSLPRQTRRIRLELGHVPENEVSLSKFSLVRNGIFSYRQDLLSMRDMKSVHDVAASGRGFKTAGRDPWLELSPALLERGQLDFRRLSLLILVFLAVSAGIFKLQTDGWTHGGDRLVSGIEKLKDYCIANRFFLIYAFACLVILFGYELFNAPVTADDDWYLLSKFEQQENSLPGAYSTVTYNSLAENFICHGRWASGVLLHVHIFTGFTPVMSLFWALLCFSAAFLVLAEKLKLPPAARYLLFPLFVGHPVFYEYFSFYMTNNTVGFIFLMFFLAAVNWPRIRDRFGFFLLLAVSAFCLCTLESLIIIFPLWFLLSFVSEGMDGGIKYQKSLFSLLKLCAVCLSILALYFLSLKYSLWLFEVQWQYLGDYLQRPDTFRAVLHFIRKLLGKMLSIFAGDYDFAIRSQLALVLLMTAAIPIRMIRKKRKVLDIALITVVLAGILILPFALDIASFNTAIPVRSMVSFPLMMAGICILGWRSLEDCPKIRAAAGLLIAFVAIQYGILVNQRSYASKLRYDQDKSVVQSIKDRCYRIPEFTAQLNEKKKIPLAVVGNLSFPKYRTFPMWSSSVLNCAFEPAVTINLHLLGETYFYPASPAEMKRIFPVAMAMPPWPAQGSVRYENGIMIVKLSGFNEIQCRQNGFPFRPVIGDNSIHRLKNLSAEAKPVWSLSPETLDSARECRVGFAGSRVIVKPSGWHSLRTKAVNADPDKIYYLQMERQNGKKGGLLYVGFSDPARYGEEVFTEIDIARGEKSCILRIPGRYLQSPISVQLGDLPGKEQVFEKFVLLERTGKEDLLTR
ncbi:MAG: glucosyltransferase domain-containing protein [Lentisphaeria bacterium]|nr:glucosyltransferase domain-containing protein [Lentisphaeria bacterium]